MAQRAFVKMHGLGNDFVIFDARQTPLDMTAERVRTLADRHTGIGCDQLIVLRQAEGVDAFMDIWNADGSAVGACGNASRCIGALLRTPGDSTPLRVQTPATCLHIERGPGDSVAVDMGPVALDWADIPLAHAADTLSVALGIDGLPAAVCCALGNPHATFFVPDADAVDITRLGPQVEHHPAFPERVNAGFAHLTPEGQIRLRVWERGAGMTRACGTAACAAQVAAIRAGMAARRGEVLLDGGMLEIDWQADGHVRMSGPARIAFRGEVAL